LQEGPRAAACPGFAEGSRPGREPVRRLPAASPAAEANVGHWLACGSWLTSGLKMRCASSHVGNQGRFLNIHLGLTPVIALLAGVLILVMPKLLNYIIAFYLIAVGLIGILGVHQLHLG
jgi:hypothetical protein